MSVILRKRINKDGTTTLRLDCYHNGKRWIETLKDLQLSKPANVADRQHNKDKIDLAKKIAVKRAQDLAAGDYAIITDTGKKTIITEWMQAYVDGYKKKDKRNMQGVLNRFINFLIEGKKAGLTFGNITELIITDFQDYLRQHSTGEGASSYFARFKKMVKQAYRQKLIQHNPAADVPTVQGNAAKKDTLTLDEIKTLAATVTESSEVKRAFLFSCITGLRWVDVKALTWQQLNTSNRYMDIRQSKTDKVVRINLNETAIKL